MFKILFILLCFNTFCYASDLSQPIIDKDLSVQTQQFLNEVANKHNVLEVTETNPDGNRRGKYGEIILLKSGGNYYVEICVSSPNGTVWRGVALTDTP